jgi:hypothetical protein
MGVVIGFIIGYWFGSSSAPLDFKEISEAWDGIKKSEEFQALLSGGSTMAKQLLENGTETLVAEMASAASSKLTLWQRTRLFLFGNA